MYNNIFHVCIFKTNGVIPSILFGNLRFSSNHMKDISIPAHKSHFILFNFYSIDEIDSI